MSNLEGEFLSSEEPSKNPFDDSFRDIQDMNSDSFIWEDLAHPDRSIIIYGEYVATNKLLALFTGDTQEKLTKRWSEADIRIRQTLMDYLESDQFKVDIATVWFKISNQ